MRHGPGSSLEDAVEKDADGWRLEATSGTSKALQPLSWRGKYAVSTPARHEVALLEARM